MSRGEKGGAPGFWTEPARVDRLRELWGEGQSAKRIADTLAGEFHDHEITRSSVIGKAHRLGLASRPSPIAGKGSGKRPRRNRGSRAAKAERALALPKLFDDAPAVVVTPKPGRSGHMNSCTRNVKPLPADEETDDMEPQAPRKLSPKTANPHTAPPRGWCQYPRGESPAWDFCGGKAKPGSSFCPAHHARCWVAAPTKPKRRIRDTMTAMLEAG
jgi:GcrA cell cycle regulator